MRAFGDGPRNFEPWSSEWMTPELASTLLTTTPHPREDVSALDRYSLHRCPTLRVFSGDWLCQTCDKANHDPIPVPLGYRSHQSFREESENSD
ncbi:hypothetical protein TNCV_4824331 [Trichonephila clavipes]|nr:hypothetical protein TNCV_4824331 [Trichonephila clavipes]